jgi:hypothetical protein
MISHLAISSAFQIGAPNAGRFGSLVNCAGERPMNYREYLAHRFGFQTFADLLDVSDCLPPTKGGTAKSYIARHRDGHWFLWEDSPVFSAGVAKESAMPIDEAKVSDAVQECMEFCRNKTAAEMFPKIREFMKSLTLSGQWTATELRAFEGEVNRVLIFGPSQGAIYGGGAKRMPGGNQATAPQASVTTA